MRADGRHKLRIPGAWLAESWRTVARASDAADVAAAVERMKVMLSARGSSLEDIAEHFERSGFELRDSLVLQAEHPITYGTVKALVDLHGPSINLADVPYLGSLLARLKRGGDPTPLECRRVEDIKARIRNKLP